MKFIISKLLMLLCCTAYLISIPIDAMSLISRGAYSRTSSGCQGVVEAASRDMMPYFYEQDLKTREKMELILSLYEKEAVDASAFHGVDGYGYGDLGREKLDRVVANLMGAEQAMVRIQIFSGTHAISSALFGVLRPGDTMLAVSGHPYDTLEEVIGLREGSQTRSLTGSMKDWGIN